MTSRKRGRLYFGLIVLTPVFLVVFLVKVYLPSLRPEGSCLSVRFSPGERGAIAECDIRINDADTYSMYLEFAVQGWEMKDHLRDLVDGKEGQVRSPDERIGIDVTVTRKTESGYVTFLENKRRIERILGWNSSMMRSIVVMHDFEPGDYRMRFETVSSLPELKAYPATLKFQESVFK
jgi:hypothetical protein